MMTALLLSAAWTAPWRSELYPTDWMPPVGKSFSSDKLIQDFSYAGYQAGGRDLPKAKGRVFNVDSPEFGADPTGERDSAQAIQKAIDAASSKGGIVRLGPGKYRVSVPAGQESALRISASNVVLQGSGAGRTFLFCSTTEMRSRAVILLQGPASSRWRNPSSVSKPILSDIPGPTLILPVENPSLFKPGSFCVVRADVTPEWVKEHKEPNWLGHESRLGGLAYWRKVVKVDPQAKTITLDAPTRYTLLKRDRARVCAAEDMIHDSGVESFSIGGAERSGSEGWGEEDYTIENSNSWHAHASSVISLLRTRDCWIKDVSSFQGGNNSLGAHFLSNGIVATECRGLTVRNCRFSHPQFGGGGGNGYMFRLSNCGESLVSDCRAEFNRHGFVLSGMASSGNVFHRCTDKDTGWAVGGSGRVKTAGRTSDHHMHFSHSNLFDQCVGISSGFQAAYRPYGTPPLHNLTSAHSVYWNTRGEGGGVPLIHTAQSRFGYAIGTSGSNPTVSLASLAKAKTDPEDHVEGVGKGETLEPQSLYLDQRRRRLKASR